MWGAIIGDLAGSIYEYNQIKEVHSLNPTCLISEKSFFSDDTILTIAILDAVLHNGDYTYYLKKYGNQFATYKPEITPYFKTSFSPQFLKWVRGEKAGVSAGNGALMRISSVGYLFSTKEEIERNAIQATIPSHNSQEAIDSAIKVVTIIFLARLGYQKEKIIKTLQLELQYTPFLKFNSTCSQTLPNCLYALFSSNSFEEALKTVISYGGDTDTNACIVGAMAEALYGLDASFILQAKEKLPEEFTTLLDKGYKRIKKLV